MHGTLVYVVVAILMSLLPTVSTLVPLLASTLLLCTCSSTHSTMVVLVVCSIGMYVIACRDEYTYSYIPVYCSIPAVADTSVLMVGECLPPTDGVMAPVVYYHTHHPGGER